MPKTVDANIGGRLTIEVGGAMSPVSSMSSPQRERAPLLEEPTIEDDEEERFGGYWEITFGQKSLF